MEMLIDVGWEMINLLNAMSPYLLFGFFMAGLLRVFLDEKMIVKHLGHSTLGAVIKASLFGIPLPLCSCGVLPTALSLRKQGASTAAVLSFLISTPTTGIDSIMATYALLGGFYTGFRVVATFFVALFVGVVALLFVKPATTKAAAGKVSASSCCHSPQLPESDCCVSKKVNPQQSLVQKLRGALIYGFGDLIRDSGKSIVLGLGIGGLIAYFIPPTFVERYLGNSLVSMLVMMAIGIPMYVCSTGSIPIVASLMMKGLNPGAGFIFLITGPATNSVSFAVIAKEFGVKVMLLFLAALALGSLAMGFLFDWVWNKMGLDFRQMMNHHHLGGLPIEVNYLSSVVLLVLIVVNWQGLRQKKG